jgi:transcriptional regulator with XRE-family HTH domain
VGFRRSRLLAGKTVEDVKKALNVSGVTVWLWETGKNKPQADKLLQIAKLYGCTVEELLQDETSVS